MTEPSQTLGSQVLVNPAAEKDERKGIEDPLPLFPKTSRKKLENDLNVEYDSLKSGYDTAKSVVCNITGSIASVCTGTREQANQSS